MAGGPPPLSLAFRSRFSPDNRGNNSKPIKKRKKVPEPGFSFFFYGWEFRRNRDAHFGEPPKMPWPGFLSVLATGGPSPHWPERPTLRRSIPTGPIIAAVELGRLKPPPFVFVKCRKLWEKGGKGTNPWPIGLPRPEAVVVS